ncbi:Hypothetical protein ORPV_632 [Orpheovirus IHUMI-LCC2]|uniref:Uncharacterized protein n=1 Tax=Orpheovirus IHUMI-LCC2 TaxID=2023057 RepID=A0A2I2L4T5_9VIRU|nr:Hypothetical protein ORPV_632 [Orpheovirus IHUMI-LCC2]SNW62536.1 Hypothetical protein ORPV_632 [Orpheovirus IHUMI-LCC2]
MLISYIMFEVKNEKEETITIINQRDYDLLMCKIPIFSLEGCNVQISDTYCGNIQNSKLALHIFLSILNNQHTKYSKDDLSNTIKLMSGLCPDLNYNDIIYIKKVMYEYDTIFLLKEYCLWLFSTYHCISIAKYKYSDNKSFFDIIIKNAMTNEICYYHKGTFIRFENGYVQFLNIKTQEYGTYDTYQFMNWCYLDDCNFYFQDDHLHIEIKSFRSKCKFHFKLVFVDDMLPIVIPISNYNNEIPHIHYSNTTRLAYDNKLMVEDDNGNIIYNDKVCNVNYQKSIFLTNDIIVKIDKTNDLVEVFKII